MITYCTNIHAGESWEEVSISLRTSLPAVKAAQSPASTFPVGLRLSNQAACELDRDRAAEFSDWCGELGFFIPTINAFPFGPFHATRVKQGVYDPDWRFPERAAYTRRLASLLAGWLPLGMTGSLSTVPVCFGKDLDEEGFEAARRNILSVLEHLQHISQRSMKTILLAFEPEPCCYLETTDEVIRFFDRLHLPDALRSHLGICFDCCHLAVQFEDAVVSLGKLERAGVRIAKVQISSAPHLSAPDRARLERLAEPVYLHQLVIRQPDGPLVRFADIPDALAREGLPRGDCRIHFHIPVFFEGTDGLGTTQGFIRDALAALDPEILLEIETYTWEVLPPGLRTGGLDDFIIREIQWLEAELHEANRSA